MMRILAAAVAIAVAGCAAEPAAPAGPPSLQVAPASYYRTTYNKKLKKRVREIIPASELTPVPPDASTREKQATEDAAAVVDQLQRQVVFPPARR